MRLFHALIGGIIGILAAGLSFLIIKLFFKKSKNNSTVFIIITLVLFSITKQVITPYVDNYYFAYNYENSLKQSYPIFQLISEKDPIEYKIYLAKAKKAIISNNDAALEEVNRNFITNEFNKYVQQASNQSLYEYAKTTLFFYKKIYGTNPQLILKIEFIPSNSNITFTPRERNLIANNINILLSSKANVIQSAIVNPQLKLSSEEKKFAKEKIINILQILANEYNHEEVEKVFFHPELAFTNPKSSAAIIISFYKLIIQSGKINCGIILRYMLYLSHEPS